MIPKTIHYCWFGGNPIPAEYQRYIDSWKSFFQTTKSENGTRTTMMFIASLSAARLMM